MALRRPLSLSPKYGISRPDQALAAPGTRGKSRISATYGWVRAKTSLGNRLKGWIVVSPVLRLKRKYTEDLIQGVPPSTSVVLRFSLKTGDQAIQPFSLFPKDVFALTRP